MRATWDKCRLGLDFYDKGRKPWLGMRVSWFEDLATFYLIIIKGIICRPFGRQRCLGRAHRFQFTE